MAAGLLVGGILFGRYLPRSAATAAIPRWRNCADRWRACTRWWRFRMLQQQSPSARMRGVTYS